MEDAVSWRVFLTDQQAQLPELEPISLRWDAVGGPEQAVLRLRKPSLGLAGMQSWLGSGVEIYDPSDRLVWWGYMDRVCQPAGKTRLESGLSEMANRVAVSYRSITPGSGFGTPAQTAWKDDLASQAIYGVKERMISHAMLSDVQALLLRDVSLRQLAVPARRLVPTTDAAAGQVVCRGWLERLRWRQWPAHSDVVGHSPTQLGNQPLGTTLKLKSLAQSFTLSNAVKLAAVSVRVRKVGTPTDKLRFQIQTDLLDAPSGSVKAEAVLSPGDFLTESYGWVSAWFAEPIAFAGGERLWLVVSRDGAVNTQSYYSVGLDENLDYVGGKLLILDSSLSKWTARVPDADLLFKLTALSDSAALLAETVRISEIAKEFTYEAGSGLSLPYVSATAQDCYQAFHELLKLGTPDLGNLLAEVTPRRSLRVYPQPVPSTPLFWLGQDGKLRDKTGKVLEPVWQAVGSWIHSETGTCCFLENLTLDVANGTYQLRTTDGL